MQYKRFHTGCVEFALLVVGNLKQHKNNIIIVIFYYQIICTVIHYSVPLCFYDNFGKCIFIGNLKKILNNYEAYARTTWLLVLTNTFASKISIISIITFARTYSNDN